MSVAEARALAEALEHAARRGDADAVEHLADELGRRLAALDAQGAMTEIRSLVGVMGRTQEVLAAVRDTLRRELDEAGWSEPAELVDGRG